MRSGLGFCAAAAIVVALAPIAYRRARASDAASRESGAPNSSPPSQQVWTDPGDMPLPAWSRSVEFLRDDEALSISPGGGRRGLVAAGVRLPLLGATRAAGCVSRWLLVGPLAYVCADRVKLTTDEPGVAPNIHPEPVDGLPYRYFFVRKGGGDAFARLADADDDAPAEQLEGGWAVATVDEVARGSESFVKTRRGRFIRKSELVAVSPTRFSGVALREGRLDVGWVVAEHARVFSAPSLTAKPAGTKPRLERVSILEVRDVGSKGPSSSFAQISGDEWMRATDLRVPVVAPPPEGVGATDRWFDVDTTTQTLVAYEGKVPVYATLVSTGRASSPTPKGTFKIWVKLRSATMSNADDAPTTVNEVSPFSIEDVPWVQYFANGVALHGAFWHRQFGSQHSHGCVNLSPLDAMHVFAWSLPRLPRGWDAAFPTTAEAATTVRVR